MNGAAVNVHVQGFVWTPVSVLLSRWPEVMLWDHILILAICIFNKNVFITVKACDTWLGSAVLTSQVKGKSWNRDWLWGQPAWDSNASSVTPPLCELVCVYAHAQLCLSLREPMNGCLPGSSVHGILQERTLEWVNMPSSRGCAQPRDRTCLLLLLKCRQILYCWAIGEAHELLGK